MSAQKVIEDLKRECAYSESGGFDNDGNDTGSVDALIAYKDALEDAYGSLLDDVAMCGQLDPPRAQPQVLCPLRRKGRLT